MPALERADAAVELQILRPRPRTASAVGGALEGLRRALLPFALLGCVWGALKLLLRLDSTILPSPLETVSAAVPLLERGILGDYVTTSLQLIAVASIVAVAIAAAGGLVLGSNRWLI